MNRLRFALLLALCTLSSVVPAPAQKPARGLTELTQKIDQQNIKIDALSQQILKLQQAIEQMKGVSPAAAPSPESIPATAPAVPVADGAATHVVTRGETLTSIAKQYKVGIEELQKFNHIENDRKLQIGQSLVIPGAPTPAPSASPNE